MATKAYLDAIAYAERLEKVFYENTAFYVHPVHGNLAVSIDFRIIRYWNSSKRNRWIEILRVFTKSPSTGKFHHAVAIHIASKPILSKKLATELIADVFLPPIKNYENIARFDSTQDWSINNISRSPCASPGALSFYNFIVTRNKETHEVSGIANLLPITKSKKGFHTVWRQCQEKDSFELNGYLVKVL